MGSSRRIPFLSTHQSSPKSAHPGATQSARNSLSACVYPHRQGDSLGLKQAGWGPSGVGGLAMGQGPLSLTAASCHTNYGTLLSPFSMARSANNPSHTHPMHDPELAVCCTLCLHKGLLAALVVHHHLPLPSFSQTSQRQNEGTQETSLEGPQSGSSCAGQPPPPLVARRCAACAFSGGSCCLHLRESTCPRGFPIPCRSQSPPQAVGRRRRLF